MTLAEEIKYCADLIRKGKVILYPTDTIWGLGCDATNNKGSELVEIPITRVAVNRDVRVRIAH